MKRLESRLWRLRVLLIGGLSALPILASEAQELASEAQELGGQAREMRLSREPTARLIRFVEEIDEIDDPDPGPSVEVWGDGRFRVHYPAYMKRAGDYEGHLSPSELAALLDQADAAPLRTLNPSDLRRRLQGRRKQGARTGQELSARSESTRTRIELRVEAQDANGVRARPQQRTLRWQDLRREAAQHPDEASLGALDALERTLRRLREHPDLKASGTRR